MKLFDLSFSHESIGIRETNSDIRYVHEGTKRRNYISAIFYPNLFNKKYQREYPWFDDLIGNAALLSSWVSFALGYFYTYYCDFKYKSFLFRTLAINDFNDIKIENNEYNKDKDNINKKNNLSENFIKDKQPKMKDENNNENIINDESNFNDYDNDEISNRNSIDCDESITEKIKEDDNKIDLDKFDFKNAFEKFKIKKKKVNISYLGYLFSCEKRSNKYNAIDQFSEKFEEKIDIVYYFKKHKNIDLLKKMLLDENQNKFIDLLSEKYNFKFKDEKSKKLNKQNTIELRSSFKNLNSKDDINKKIIEKLLRNQQNNNIN